MYIECACVRAEQEVEVFFFVLYIQCMYIYIQYLLDQKPRLTTPFFHSVAEGGHSSRVATI